MNNIIANLRRDRPLSWENRLEAADEIFRLRSELTDYKDAAASEADRVNELTAENRSLREENARLRELVVSEREENARLRNDNFKWLQHLSSTNHQLEREQKEIQKLREAVKAAYYEGWQDNASIDDSEDGLPEWEYSKAYAAIREREEASDSETPMRRSFSGGDDE